mgnify:CR=1 FL=1
MFLTKKNLEELKKEAFKEGRDSFISDFKKWQNKFTAKEEALEKSFSISDIKSFNVNVWDDYPENGTTYAYVESSDTPDKVCIEVLIHLLGFANANSVIQGVGAKLGIRFYDSSNIHPILIGAAGREFSLFKRWEMTIDGASYEDLELIVNELKKTPSYKDKTVSVYSES